MTEVNETESKTNDLGMNSLESGDFENQVSEPKKINPENPEKQTEIANCENETIKVENEENKKENSSNDAPIDYIDNIEESSIDLNSEKKENETIPQSSNDLQCENDDLKCSSNNDIKLDSRECGQGDGHARASTSNVRTTSPESSVYHVKWIKWKDNKTAVITQNENGPCPLIAIMNVLILKGKVQLPSVMEMITANQVFEYLGDAILNYTPQNISEDTQRNYEQNMNDAMDLLPKLQTGLDVNVKFTGVSDFEFTPECIIFDLLNIHLFHGWLVDPQNTDVVYSIGKLSYNQLVEKIITDKCSTDADVAANALIAESFLERTASQLTYHGLCELNSAIKQDELGVLFRNNHFSTIYKYKNELFQLVTDQGFLTESNVVWETLSNIDGDGQFVDYNFYTVPPKTVPCAMIPTMVPSEQQVDQDYLVALSLQEEQRRLEEQEVAWKEYKEKQLGVGNNITDEELARRLQMEERELQSDSAAQRPSAPISTTTERPVEPKKKNDCVIL